MLIISEVWKWEEAANAPVHVFSDASSTPPQLGVVVVGMDTAFEWTSMKLGQQVRFFFFSAIDASCLTNFSN